MKSIFLVTANNQFVIFGYGKALFLFLLISVCFVSPLTAGKVGQTSLPDITKKSGDACPAKEEIISKIRILQMPFITNNGQVDERVRFYAKAFGGTVFVTKDGEIVYSLPSGRDVTAGASLESGRGHEAWRLGSRGAEGQGGKAVSGWYGHAPFVRAESGFIVANVYSPLLYVDNANCPPGRVFANALLSAYLPGLQKETARQVVSTSLPPNYHPHSEIQNPQSPVRGVVLKETLTGAKIGGITGEQPAITTANYFTGNDKSKWKTNVPTYNKVSLGEVYEGIELSLKAYGNNVEKRFCVKPGGSPECIKVQIDGYKSLRVNNDGQLEADTDLGMVKFTRPIAYQEIEGQRVAVAVEYSIHSSGIGETEGRGAGGQGGRGEPEAQNQELETRNSKSTYGFTVASYDKTKDLIIDPLLASTYLGGSYAEYGYSLTFDTSGNVYVTGFTWSPDFPTTSGVYDTSFNDGYYSDVFVSKLDGGLTTLLASTYLGGSHDDRGSSLALDTSGNVCVTGETVSTNFPTTSGAYDTSFNGGGFRDVFVSKLDSGLTSLLASTFLGGSNDDQVYALTLDTSGNVYVTGETFSLDFPTTNGAYNTSFNGGTKDVFVSKLNSGLTSLPASTFLGGAFYDRGSSLTLDTSGNVYVTGETTSPDFPTTSGAYDTSFNGYGSSDVFVSKLNSGLTSLPASTFLGGASTEYCYALALDTSGNAYVTGYTTSSDFPTTSGAYDTSLNGSGDVFVSELDGGLTSLLSSTYLGGAYTEYGSSLALDTSGNAYVTGFTESYNFPTTIWAYDTSFNGVKDVFVSKLNSGLTSLLASTYLGGANEDRGHALALGTSGNAYVTGGTVSTNFPAARGAYDTSFNGTLDVFVSCFDRNLSAGKDTDGDGLLDDWEINGYDAERDGVIDVNLPAMGANYKHKDIFVEIDWMANNNHTHKPSAAALREVKKSFKAAPVTNPDKVDGINIHFDIGQLGGGNVVAHDNDLNPVWDEFDAIKNVHFDKKRERIFHYCLFAHNYDGDASSGISRGIPASDFIVSLGSWDNQVGTKKQQAGTLMHELGHNLGLRHGGNDDVNYKPNFLSIMNYFFQMAMLRYDGKDQTLDYSRLDINDLDENTLREKKGLDQVGGDSSLRKYGTRYFDTNGIARVTSRSYKNVDWNGDTIISAPDVAVDINNDIGKNVLTGRCEEWMKIVYDGGSVGAGLMAVIKNPPPTCPEFTYEKYLWLKDSTVETE